MEVQSTSSEPPKGSLGKTHKLDQKNLALLNDEVLRTFLVEIGKILNDRPITSASSDPQDFEALMPNHILLLRRNQSFCLDVFEESDKFKARWKHVHLKLPFMQPVGRRRVPDS